MSAQGPQYFGNRKRQGEEGRFRQETAAQTPLPTRGQMLTKPLPGGRVLDLRKQRRAAPRPHHPFELYRTVSNEQPGWAVYPASVNGTIDPEIDGLSIFDRPVPILSLEENFTAYLEFDVTCNSMQVSGTWILRAGKAILSNVAITLDPGDEREIVVDPDTGHVTSGHRVFQIGVVAGGEKTEQNMRFSVNYSMCSDGVLQISEYG